MQMCKRCLVSGIVQGVFFRASTQQQATKLGIGGYAKNLPDGRVEVLACGEQQNIDTLMEWLHDGPRLARVDRLECIEIQPNQSYSRFSTG